jgi:uncharacterized protein involved in propanediol utilization
VTGRLELCAPGLERVGAVGTGRAFGTFGELLQGTLDDRDTDFLVTLPIARWVTARFEVGPVGQPLRVFPASKRKALRLVRLMTRTLGVRTGGVLVLDGDLPEGKGLASSSADLVATARAVGAALGVNTPPLAIEGWLRSIEPSDGVMYPGVVAFDHRDVRLRAFLGALPALTIVAVDEGGQVDTVEFNRRPKPFSTVDKREYTRLLEAVMAAVRTGDLETVGAVATRSSMLNVKQQPRRFLKDLLRICEAVGGLGVVSTHSGTMVGVLLCDADPNYPDRLARVLRECAALPAAVSLFHSLRFPRPDTERWHAL